MTTIQPSFADSEIAVPSRQSGRAGERDLRILAGRVGWRWPRLTVPDLLLPLALALWAIGIRDANTSAVNQYGLLPAVPLAYFAGFLVLLVSIGFLLARRELSAPRLALHLATLVFMIHGTAPLVYAEPRFSWAYKHFGVVNHINVHGELDASIDIYNNWPGFFALAAWFGRIAGFDGPPGAYNLADDAPAPQSDVLAYAAALLGIEPTPEVSLGSADLTPQARAFYAENRRVANGKAKRLLGWRPRYPDYRLGLRALSAITSPASTSTAPAPASSDQR